MHRLRDNYKLHSQELLNNLFKHPYTKIEFVVNDLGVLRLTAANYLNKKAFGLFLYQRLFLKGMGPDLFPKIRAKNCLCLYPETLCSAQHSCRSHEPEPACSHHDQE
jgi:hypothetical protein